MLLYNCFKVYLKHLNFTNYIKIHQLIISYLLVDNAIFKAMNIDSYNWALLKTIVVSIFYIFQESMKELDFSLLKIIQNLFSS
jgi:hypothetical protein